MAVTFSRTMKYFAGAAAILVLLVTAYWNGDSKESVATYARVMPGPAPTRPNVLLAIINQGGTLEVDDQHPDQIAIKVALADVVVTNEVLAQLAQLKNLKSLDLQG